MLSLMKIYKFDHTTVSIEYQLLRETYVLSKMKLLFQSWFLGVEVCVVKFGSLCRDLGICVVNWGGLCRDSEVCVVIRGFVVAETGHRRTGLISSQ